jgi:hypothetical protein
LSDKLEIEIIFGFSFNKALLKNMLQIPRLVPHLRPNIRSFSIIYCIDLGIEDLIVIKNNTNLVEMNVYYTISRQKIFNFICDNFFQLKSFGFKTFISISLRNLEEL